MPNPITEEQRAWIDEAKEYHAPDAAQLAAYASISVAFEAFAETIYVNVPASADRTDALRKLQEVKMTCNQSIALRGLGIAR